MMGISCHLRPSEKYCSTAPMIDEKRRYKNEVLSLSIRRLVREPAASRIVIISKGCMGSM